MAIRNIPVSRCLDKKLMILGFEVPEMLLIFLVLSVLQLLFSDANADLLYIWMPTALLSGVIRLSKRGKPEKHLIHWIRFHTKPGTLSAFADPAKGNFAPIRRSQSC